MFVQTLQGRVLRHTDKGATDGEHMDKEAYKACKTAQLMDQNDIEDAELRAKDLQAEVGYAYEEQFDY